MLLCHDQTRDMLDVVHGARELARGIERTRHLVEGLERRLVDALTNGADVRSGLTELRSLLELFHQECVRPRAPMSPCDTRSRLSRSERAFKQSRCEGPQEAERAAAEHHGHHVEPPLPQHQHREDGDAQREGDPIEMA
jgi:hypothetical protein